MSNDNRTDEVKEVKIFTDSTNKLHKDVYDSLVHIVLGAAYGSVTSDMQLNSAIWVLERTNAETLVFDPKL